MNGRCGCFEKGHQYLYSDCLYISDYFASQIQRVGFTSSLVPVLYCSGFLFCPCVMDDYSEFRDFLIARGCPGSSRDLTKVLVWLRQEHVTGPEDLQHLRKLCHFKGVDNFHCNIIAFIGSLIGVCCSASPFHFAGLWSCL